MTLTFNMLLRDVGVDPAETRLLRHETRNYGMTPYALWRDDRGAFNKYQALQKEARRAWFSSPYWASFVVTPDQKTLFAGLYQTKLLGLPPADWVDPISRRSGEGLLGYEQYEAEIDDRLDAYVGRLIIDWGPGTRSWVQRASAQEKIIAELRTTFIEPPFPGYTSFIVQLSGLETLPRSWQAALAASRGVYLLTCPKTREQYVGSASGDGGFLRRWLDYFRTGHGGNTALRDRDPSDYRVSILQVAGSADGADAILAMEANWKGKLQSREMGLNRN